MRSDRLPTPPCAWWVAFGGLVLGYLVMSRSFAYLGWPPLNVFIGELTLGALLVCHWRELGAIWLDLVRGAPMLRAVAWSLVGVGAYGVVEFAIGVSRGYPWLTALKGLAFSYYPIFLVVGIWLGTGEFQLLPALVRALAWVNGLYGVLFVLLLGWLPYTMPGAPQVPLFGQPIGSSVALLGLAAFGEDRRTRLRLVLLNAFVLLGMQVRAEWLGLVLGLTVLTVTVRRVARSLECVGVIALLLAVCALFDVRIPSPTGRGGEFAALEIVARVVALIDADQAAKLSSHAQFYVDTVNWRLEWWHAILVSLFRDADPVRMLFGYGLGFPLHALVTYVPGDVRSPHNALLFALAYGGLVGALAFVGLQASLGVALWRAFRTWHEAFPVAYWVLVMAVAFFSNFLETPFGAIPFFVLTGLAVARLLRPAAAVPVGLEDAPK